VVPVYRSETRREVGYHAPQRVSGVEASFSLETGEPLRGLGGKYERMHEILTRMVHPDEQAVLDAPHVDHFAVDPQEPAPLRLELDRGL
jgi:hypothetical protein